MQDGTSGPIDNIDLCLATPTFAPDYSGPGIRFKRYAPLLEEKRVAMRVLTASGTERPTGRKRREWLAEGITRPERVDGIPVVRVPIDPSLGRRRWHWRFDRSLFRYCRTGGTPDVVQLLSLCEVSTPYWVRRLRRGGVPVVYTHTMMRDPSIGGIKNRLWLLPFRHVDCTVVSTMSMRDSLHASGFEGPIRVIPNGVDTRRFSPPPTAEDVHALRDSLSIRRDAEVVVFVGGYLIERKGLDLLAEAWVEIAAARPRAHLLLVGPTRDALGRRGPDGSFTDRLNATLASSHAMDRVTFAGAVTDVERYLQLSDVFVFPSRREGMPNVVHEAYATALPSVICPFVGMSREFGMPGQHFVHAEHDPAAIATGVVELLQDESRRTVLGRTARSWVETGFRTEDSVEAYCDLYRELVASRPGRTSHER